MRIYKSTRLEERKLKQREDDGYIRRFSSGSTSLESMSGESARGWGIASHLASKRLELQAAPTFLSFLAFPSLHVAQELHAFSHPLGSSASQLSPPQKIRHH
jgi:hypothetical protein